MNYADLKIRILRSLIGQSTTLKISQTLGYSFNQVERWLSGTKQCRWDEFWQLCQVLGYPIDDATERVFYFSKKNTFDETINTRLITSESVAFIKHLRLLRSHEPIELLADKINVHASALKRYFRGETSPDLEVVLAIMNLTNHNLASFLINLLGFKKMESFTEFQKDLEQLRTETFWPSASAIEACLNIEDYLNLKEHSDEFIANHIGLPVEEVRFLIPILVEKGHITQIDKKYTINYKSINTTGVDNASICRMVNFWTNRATLRFSSADHVPISKGDSRSVVAYRIAPMSIEASQKITKLLVQTQQEILNILENDENPRTEVRAVLLHHYSTKDRPDDLFQTKEKIKMNYSDLLHKSEI